ncbi:MAG TPA: dockerin type I repeat-containing protein [Bacteroidales bacterium]|nr:dockerin type I repeat-containing protein [Bacteroidales bacterium]HSA42398.1 dockerin type I repeat-containing protein [Bacteroidales bacterium]
MILFSIYKVLAQPSAAFSAFRRILFLAICVPLTTTAQTLLPEEHSGTTVPESWYEEKSNDISDIWSTSFTAIAGGCTFQVQTSLDGSSWLNEPGGFHSGSGNPGPVDENMANPACESNSFSCLDSYPLPFTESFDIEAFPTGWNQFSFTAFPVWSVFGSNYAGGQAAELISTWAVGTGETRLVLPPVQTAGISQALLSFRQYFADALPGLTCKIQTSSDMITWQDAGWEFLSGAGDLGPETVELQISQNLEAVLYLSFLMSGDHSSYYFWSIDEISLTESTPLPDCSNLIYPPENCIIGAQDIELQWDMADFAEGYSLSIGTDNPPSNMLLLYDAGNQTSFTLTGLQPSLTCYWQVTPYNAAGPTAGCEIWSFTPVQPLLIPYQETFDEPGIPEGWSQQTILAYDPWITGEFNYAGGTPYEVFCTQAEGYGISRLILPPLNTNGLTDLPLSFRHAISALDTGTTLKIQSSSDLVNWIDCGWEYSTDIGQLIGPGEESISIVLDSGPVSYLAFVIDGDHGMLNYWAIDEIEVLTASPPMVFDLSEGGGFCPGSPGLALCLYGSQAGILYQLFRDSLECLPPFTGTGDTLCWPDLPAGSYTVAATDPVTGLTSTMNGNPGIIAFTAPMVNAGPDQFIVFGAFTQLNSSVYGGNPPYTYLWSPATYLSAVDIPDPVCTPSWHITYYLQVSDSNSCQGMDSISVFVFGPSPEFSGTVSYDNQVQSVLPGCTVSLLVNGILFTTTATDTGGYYHFGFPYTVGIWPGDTIKITVTSSLPWGGGNAIDALLIMKHFVNINLLTGLRLQAADVDNSGYVNSIDALSVMKRFVNLINSFPAGDWKFESPSAIYQWQQFTQLNIKGVCNGDVDASYTMPP